MMDKLYGEETATAVYDRCQELGENFNTLVQEYVYDIFWARPGLSLKEKSLVTIISLITLNKVEQLRIHVKGFLHQGGTGEDIRNIINHMEHSGYIASSHNVLNHLNAVIPSHQEQTYSNKKSLSAKDIALIDLSSHIALGNNQKTEACIRKLLKQQLLSKDNIENTMLHQIIYCGFPCAMNGHAVLKNINDSENLQ